MIGKSFETIGHDHAGLLDKAKRHSLGNIRGINEQGVSGQGFIGQSVSGQSGSGQSVSGQSVMLASLFAIFLCNTFFPVAGWLSRKRHG